MMVHMLYHQNRDHPAVVYEYYEALQNRNESSRGMMMI